MCSMVSQTLSGWELRCAVPFIIFLRIGGGGVMPEEFDPDTADDLVDRMPEDIEDVDARLGGGAVRDILVDWCKAN
jgi:hypothetical protein